MCAVSDGTASSAARSCRANKDVAGLKVPLPRGPVVGGRTPEQREWRIVASSAPTAALAAGRREGVERMGHPARPTAVVDAREDAPARIPVARPRPDYTA